MKGIDGVFNYSCGYLTLNRQDNQSSSKGIAKRENIFVDVFSKFLKNLD